MPADLMTPGDVLRLPSGRCVRIVAIVGARARASCRYCPVDEEDEAEAEEVAFMLSFLARFGRPVRLSPLPG